MALTHTRYTVGTAIAQVAVDSGDAQSVILQNLSPGSTEEYSRDGYTFLLQREFTVNSPGTAIFEVAVGSRGLQLDFYEIVSTVSNLKAELIEGATVGTTGSPIPAYNLNRNFSDTHQTTFTAGTSISGGTVVAAEYITADKHAASSGAASGKIYTLAPSTDYAFKFVNKGNQSTTVFFQMTFTEQYNGNTDIWVGDAVGTGVRIRGGDTVQMDLMQGQKLFAVSSDSNDLMVTRQD